jgi:hypothetical protein
MTVVIIGTWGRSIKRVNFRHDRCSLCDLTQAPLIKTVMSEVTRLYDLPQVPMIKTVIVLIIST